MGEKTEDATPRKISKSRERGQVAKSQDLSAAIGLAAAVGLLGVFGASLMRHFAHVLERVWEGQTPGDPLSIDGIIGASRWVGATTAIAVLPIFLLVFLIAYLTNLLQVGWLLTMYPVKPKWSKVSPVAGLKRLLSLKTLVKSGVNALKLVVVGGVAGLVLWRSIPELIALPRLHAEIALFAIGKLAMELSLWLLLVLILLAIIDFMYQKWQYKKDLKMTKHEIKDERRSMEGDPHVKKQRMKMAMEVATQRIQGAVPDADVVVSNPTHFAVALKYDGDAMGAPRLVAKGADLLAYRIRQVAIANAVPIVERAPLARAIYWGVDVGHEIPPHLYEAVAEILAYVYRTEKSAA